MDQATQGAGKIHPAPFTLLPGSVRMTIPLFDARAYQAALATRAIGRFLEYRPVVDTTMRLARRAAEEGAPHGSVVLTDEQTAGRGRQGRTFLSPPGENLYFTFVLRGSPASLRHLPLAVPVAVCTAVRDEGVDALVKWPNDIWVRGRKLSGMLIDVEGEGESLTALPGIGINVTTEFRDFPELAPIATSIGAELGRAVGREALLARVCNQLELLLDCPRDVLLARYRTLSLVLGRQVEVTSRDGRAFVGVAEDIEEDGALRVRSGRGTELVLAADVSLRPAGSLDPSR